MIIKTQFKLKEYKNGLYLVSTPLGNLNDITLRAIEVLKKSDYILCEDTRVSKNLLDKYQIKSNLISNHKFNEKKNLKMVLELLNKKKVISLISDAGTPGISDPGRLLFQECIKKKINVFPIPGASAVSSAISISGFSDKYYFSGFLPEKKNKLIELFHEILELKCSFVFFVSPGKLKKNLSIIKKYFSDRDILICREISKYFEEYIRSSVKELSEINISNKGEITVVISESYNSNLNSNELEESDKVEIKNLIKKMTIKDIVKKVTTKKKISKKLVYEYCLIIKNEN